MNTDLDSGLITIAGELVDDSWELFEGASKTDWSAVMIALDSRAVAVLRAHLERQAAEREEWNRHAAEERAKGKDTPDWVDTRKEFTDADSPGCTRRRSAKSFGACARRAGLPPIHLRALRHCAATLIHAGGGDLRAIKETLRHGTVQLASDTYTALLEEVDREITERAADIVPRARRSEENGVRERCQSGG
ncbi:hypothetical protein [Streptomyces albus]|uniref:hypothetical protein n=1 Tax=Streptomyces albus TaxID=1888 RepID=UPI0006E2D661|nr:hypothetical protein [Streptomyces albus]